MIDKSTIEKLTDRAPLAIIIIGMIAFIVGAAGRLPVGNPPLQITDLAWRIALGAMGLTLAIVGILLIARESEFPNRNNQKTTVSKYGIKIDSPSKGAQLSEPRPIIYGSYSVKPPDGTLCVFMASYPDGKRFWPQETIIDFDERNKKWQGRFHLANPTYSVFVLVAIVGQSSQKFWDYYYKVGKMTNWAPIDSPLPPDIIECDRVWITRV